MQFAIVVTPFNCCVLTSKRILLMFDVGNKMSVIKKIINVPPNKGAIPINKLPAIEKKLRLLNE